MSEDHIKGLNLRVGPQYLYRHVAAFIHGLHLLPPPHIRDLPVLPFDKKLGIARRVAQSKKLVPLLRHQRICAVNFFEHGALGLEEGAGPALLLLLDGIRGQARDKQEHLTKKQNEARNMESKMNYKEVARALNFAKNAVTALDSLLRGPSNAR